MNICKSLLFIFLVSITGISNAEKVSTKVLFFNYRNLYGSLKESADLSTVCAKINKFCSASKPSDANKIKRLGVYRQELGKRFHQNVKKGMQVITDKFNADAIIETGLGYANPSCNVTRELGDLLNNEYLGNKENFLIMDDINKIINS